LGQTIQNYNFTYRNEWLYSMVSRPKGKEKVKR
jgi:hypothetical protein